MSYTLNNNLKVFLKSKQGKELKPWLEEHKDELKNHRIFYILRAKVERGDVFKIGLSERGDNSAYGRLNDYYHFYGETKKKFPNPNPCMGVRLHLVIGNLFNPSVQTSDSKVRQIETKMIQSLGKAERGRERFKISIDNLFKTIEDLGFLNEDEQAEATKRSSRVLKQNKASKDTVKAIVGRKIDSQGKLKFEVEFYDYLKPDQDKSLKGKLTKQNNKFMSYDELVQLREGKRLVDAYMKRLEDYDDEFDDEPLTQRSIYINQIKKNQEKYRSMLESIKKLS